MMETEETRQELLAQAKQVFVRVNQMSVDLSRNHPKSVGRVVYSQAWHDAETAIEEAIGRSSKELCNTLLENYEKRAQVFFARLEEQLNGNETTE